MDIRDFLQRLQVKSGPGATGEYLCRCPAHEDKTASLCVRDGDKGIVIKCQAGCDSQAVLASLNLTMKELFHAGQERPKPAAAAGSENAKRWPSYEAAYGSLGRFVCAYRYLDAQGKPLFEVARIDTSRDGKRSKTFRQHVLVGPGFTFPLVKGVPDALKDTLYRLPEVIAAKAAKEPIYLVEGEKDADSLAKTGRCATTGVMGAGKWREAHSEALRDCQVIIIQDNDKPGQDHARLVAGCLAGRAREVRVIDLTKMMPELPEHGDISDVIEKLGPEAALTALDQAVQATAPESKEAQMTPKDAADYYDRVYGYCVDHGRICQSSQDGPKPLANFLVLPRAVITRDDGVNVTQETVLDGWTMDGAQLPRVSVKTSEFDSMGWVTKHWDFRANIAPGNTIKDRLRYAISEVGRISCERTVQYTHTGWRKVGGKWAYLYEGGAIGAEGVTVSLGSGLYMYRLDGGMEISTKAGIVCTLGLEDVIARHVVIPLLGTLFLSPLREFLAASGIAPAYALFLLGGTGTRKSTAAALGLSHFGDFTPKSLPASFNDTANFIRKKAFLLKDIPIVVDDYHPVTNLQERKKMEATAQSLARAFGDGAERGRMKSDLTLQEAMPPRGMAIISGEDTPGVGESGMARFYVVNVGREDIPATSRLTEAQELARQGYLQASMRGYLNWLLGQIDTLPESLHEEFIKSRAKALDLTRGQHGRTAEAIAHMMLGYDMMLRYMMDAGVLSQAETEKMSAHAWQVVCQNSARQSDETREERPSKLFLSSINELLISKAVGVRDLSDSRGEAASPINAIGYMDESFFYLMPQMAYRAVAKLCSDQGQAFPLTSKMLYKQLREDGVLTADTTTGTSSTRPKWIDGKPQRLLWIPRVWIDGKQPGGEQISMMEDRETGFRVVDEPAPF